MSLGKYFSPHFRYTPKETEEYKDRASVLLQYYATKRHLVEVLESAEISEVDKLQFIEQWDEGTLPNTDKIAFWSLANKQHRVDIVLQTQLHAYIKKSLLDLFDREGVEFPVDEGELDELLYSVVKLGNLHYLEFEGLLPVNEDTSIFFREAHSIDHKKSAVDYWLGQDNLLKRLEAEKLSSSKMNKAEIVNVNIQLRKVEAEKLTELIKFLSENFRGAYTITIN